MEKFFRKPIFEYSTKKNLLVQFIDYHITHTEKNKLVIKAFGVSEIGESILVNVSGFCPFFYIKLPEHFTKGDANLLLSSLKSKLSVNLSNGLITEMCEIQEKRLFFPYSPNNERFMKLSFCSDITKYSIVKILKKPVFVGRKRIQFELFETKIESLLRFFHVTGIQPSGITKISEFSLEPIKSGYTQLEISCNVFNLTKANTETEIRFPLLQMSFDIEVYSKDNTFPKPEILENVVTHIGSKFTWSDKHRSHLEYLVSLKTEPINEPGIFHFVFEKERDLLVHFVEHMRNLDPDIIYQYNGDHFDWNFIAVRCQMHRIPLEITKLKSVPAVIKNDTFSSSAYGSSEYRRLIITGRINFDILIFMQREFKENSYKLDDISKKYLGKQKNDISVNQIFDSYRNNDLVLSKRVGYYCLQDALLPQQLVEYFHILESQVGMSNVTLVPFNYLFCKGQEIKAFSQIYYKTLAKGYVVPDVFETKTDEKFTGATVLDPKVGGYFKNPIAVLDFEGLYPSIMMAHNLCYSSYVKKGTNVGKDVKTFSWTDIHGTHNYSFVQETDSILPELLLELKKNRGIAKKLKKESTGLIAVIADKRQLAYKVSMNSIYGYLSAFKMHCKPIGATVTYLGRQMISDTASLTLKNYPKSTVIYGDTDSVFIDFGVSLKETETLGKQAAQEITKIFKRPINLEYEKFYFPFIMLSKKRYLGMKYEGPGEPKLDSKGLVINRRDSSDLLKRCYKGIINLLMKSEKEKAIEYIVGEIQKLRKLQFDPNELMITKTYKRIDYKNQNLPHIVVAEKKKSRGEDVNINDRINYMFIKNGCKKTAPQYLRIEDFEFAIKNQIEPDIEYYIEKQLKNSIIDILSAVVGTEAAKGIFQTQTKIKPKKDFFTVSVPKK